MEAADGAELDVVLVEDGEFEFEEMFEQVEEGIHLFAWTFPVFGGEGEKGQALDAEFGAGGGDSANSTCAAAVSFHAWQAAFRGPAAISVHNDRDVTRHDWLRDWRFGQQGTGGRGVQGDGSVVNLTKGQAFFPRRSAGSVKNHGLFPIWADADDAELGAADFGKFEQVGARVFWEVFPVSDGVGGRFPAWHLDAEGFACGELCVVERGDFEGFAVEFVAGADFDAVEGVESVEVGDREVVDAVDHSRVPDGDGVEPTAAAGASGGCAEFATHPVEHVADSLVFCGEWAFADAGGVGFYHAQHAVDVVRGYARAGAGATGGGVGTGNVRVSAVVDIEEGALGAFKQDFAPLFHGVMEIDHRISNEGAEEFRGFHASSEGAFKVDRLDAEGRENGVIFADALREFGGECFRQEKVCDAETSSRDFVAVGRANPAFGGADFRVAACYLLRLIELAVVGKDKVCGVTDEQVGGGHGDAFITEAFDFASHRDGV